MAKKKTTLTDLGKAIAGIGKKVTDVAKKSEPIIGAVEKVNSNMPSNYNENTAASAVDYAVAAASRPKSFNYNDPHLKNYYERLMNRKDFSFDLNGNALWNQYKDHYTKLGQMAMADTVGQSSALTGGYGNSWAQSAGQQSYQQNLENLNNVIPELYQLALQQYQAEGDELLNRYSVASGERDFAYGQYRDEVADWQNERNFQYGKYTDERDFDYQQKRDDVEDEQWNKTFGLEKSKFSWQKEVDKRDYKLEVSKNNFDEWYKKENLKLEKEAQKATTSYQKEQIKLAKAELAEKKRQADLDYALEKAQLAETTRYHNLVSGDGTTPKKKDDSPEKIKDITRADLSEFAYTILSNILYHPSSASEHANNISKSAASGDLTDEEVKLLIKELLAVTKNATVKKGIKDDFSEYGV